jgi:site-specific recombinase XerD
MREPKPFYKSSHCAWYLNQAGKQVRLVDGPTCVHRTQKFDDKRRCAACTQQEALAHEEWHKLRTIKTPKVDPSILELFKSFLDAKKRDSKLGTFEFYDRHLGSFTNWLNAKGLKLRWSTLIPKHVNDWIAESHPDAGPTYRHNLIRSVKAPFSWAKDEGLARHCGDRPLDGLKAPKQRTCQADVESDDWQRFVAAADCDEVRDVLTTLKETGCRPLELRTVERRHVQASAWVFPVDESKAGDVTDDQRIVLLNERALPITQRLMARNPEGPLFRDPQGKPWTKRTLLYQFDKLAAASGVKLTPKVVRHVFATDGIEKGVDVATMAALMGHQDHKMVLQVYNKVKKRSKHMQESLRRATG